MSISGMDLADAYVYWIRFGRMVGSTYGDQSRIFFFSCVHATLYVTILPAPQDTDVSCFLTEISNKPRLDHVFESYVFKYGGTHSVDI